MHTLAMSCIYDEKYMYSEVCSLNCYSLCLMTVYEFISY